MGSFEKFAAKALGSDAPEKVSALKEAIMACMHGYEEEGEDKEPTGGELAEGSGPLMSTLFGGKK